MKPNDRAMGGPPIDVMNTSIRDLLEGAVAAVPEKVYLYFADQEITYRQFNARVNQVANALLSWGLRKGDMVGMFMGNHPEMLYTYFAAAKIGAVMVPMNTGYPPEELAYAISHSEQQLLIADLQLRSVVEEARSGCPRLREVVYVSKEPLSGARTFAEFVAGQPETLEPTDVKADDLVSCIYTSGTTARPKGVLLDQRAYLLGAEFWGGAVNFGPSDRLLSVFPLFHANCGVYLVIGAVLYRCSLIVLETFSAKGFWDAARRYGATYANTVGSISAILFAQPPSDADREHQITRVLNGINVGGIKAEFEKRFGLTMCDGYSLTECLTGCAERLDDLATRTPGRLYTIGRPADRVQLRLVGDDGKDVPVGQVGEIWLKGPAICRGYFKDPQKTAEAIVDGWLRTGDNARMDEEGYLYFADRKKDMIKRRGENIASAEVERVLNSHPKVQESAVIGVPDLYADEEVKAYIVLKPGEEWAPEDVIEYCREYLEPFKIPRYIEFRASLPKGKVLPKIMKTELRAERPDLTEGCYDRGPKLPPPKAKA